ncbi:hypothetical protein D9757_012800 [Collybiopsis confluens]|uniref:NADP-dependent oxidoreductase domain-containing protein n=1 Tax=Collybiopsis confluens TaxID=2823264 RepID=A0A8H5GJ22_9AGAR|nr:hypothetical protein D9757_012800 [Collybiopsis confluens]
MSPLQPLAPPPTKLGRYRQLSPRAAIHVSPLSLGGMSLGDKWDLGEMNKESSIKLLDAYYDAGGNFIDTANFYQDGSSEEYANYTHNGNSDIAQRVNFTGSNTKSMKLSLESSLERFQTTYIDLFYVHWWDGYTLVEEMMDALHNLVVSGKVLYLGVSNFPAWLVAKANGYARANGKTPFVVYQGEYSILKRDLETEIIPMCQHEDMGVIAYGTLASGRIRTTEEENRRIQSGEGGRSLMRPDWQRRPEEVKVCDGLEELAKKIGAKSIGAGNVPFPFDLLELKKNLRLFVFVSMFYLVAIAYALQKSQYFFPILGGRKVEHLLQNLEALDITLTPEHIKFLDDLNPLKLGFPYNIFGLQGYPFVFTAHAHLDGIPHPTPIQPAKDS